MRLQNNYAKRVKGLICLSVVLASTKCNPITPTGMISGLH